MVGLHKAPCIGIENAPDRATVDTVVSDQLATSTMAYLKEVGP